MYWLYFVIAYNNYIQMNTDKSMNPILAELKIVKNKLEIQSKIIQLLTN